jgi:hypothetical protein
MLSEITNCQKGKISEKERTEVSFLVANYYRNKLKELISKRGFENESEEIYFFRNVKPNFTCHSEYFYKLKVAMSKAPVEKNRAIEFWKNERNCLNQFCITHSSFVRYYESGERIFDAFYFLRKSNDLRSVPNLYFHDSDVDWCTSHDKLVRDYLTYKKYKEYCVTKLFGLLLV